MFVEASNPPSSEREWLECVGGLQSSYDNTDPKKLSYRQLLKMEDLTNTLQQKVEAEDPELEKLMQKIKFETAMTAPFPLDVVKQTLEATATETNNAKKALSDFDEHIATALGIEPKLWHDLMRDGPKPFSYDGASQIATACGSTLDRERDVEKAVHDVCSREHSDRFWTEDQMQARQKRAHQHHASLRAFTSTSPLEGSLSTGDKRSAGFSLHSSNLSLRALKNVASGLMDSKRRSRTPSAQE